MAHRPGEVAGALFGGYRALKVATAVPSRWFQLASCCCNHEMLLSVWQMRQALGLFSWPKRAVIPALGMSSMVWVMVLKPTVVMIFGMWQAVQRLPSDLAA